MDESEKGKQTLQLSQYEIFIWLSPLWPNGWSCNSPPDPSRCSPKLCFSQSWVVGDWYSTGEGGVLCYPGQMHHHSIPADFWLVKMNCGGVFTNGNLPSGFLGYYLTHGFQTFASDLQEPLLSGILKLLSHWINIGCKSEISLSHALRSWGNTTVLSGPI